MSIINYYQQFNVLVQFFHYQITSQSKQYSLVIYILRTVTIFFSLSFLLYVSLDVYKWYIALYVFTLHMIWKLHTRVPIWITITMPLCFFLHYYIINCGFFPFILNTTNQNNTKQNSKYSINCSLHQQRFCVHQYW